MNKKIFSLFILLLVCGSVDATRIDFFYPNNNTTTEIWYANGGYDYHKTYNNTVDEIDLRVVIVKDHKEYINVLDNPSAVMTPLTHWFFIFFIIILAGSLLVILKKVITR